MRKNIFFILVFTSTVFFAQQRTCGTKAFMKTIQEDAILRAEFETQQQKFLEEYQKLITNFNRNGNNQNIINNNPIRIPVAVHYTASGSATPAVRTCLTNLAQTQIDILNADYNATNDDLSLWETASELYPGINIGNMNVIFELATQNHPAGSGLTNGQPAVTFGYNFGNGQNRDTAWTGYFNIIIRNLGNGTLGFSPLGPNLSGWGVTIDNNSFSSGSGCTGVIPQAPFNLGRTLTHELGHFFNLDHTFNSNNCNPESNCASTANGDGVCDTPQLVEPTFQCPGLGEVASCDFEFPALTMNYMDYTNDACMYMFTQGQATRMTAWFNSVQSQIKQNALSNVDLLENNLVIYPNPAKDILNVNFKEVPSNLFVVLYDQTGKVVYEKAFNDTLEPTTTISIADFAKGVYFINLKSDDKTITRKVIIE